MSLRRPWRFALAVHDPRLFRSAGVHRALLVYVPGMPALSLPDGLSIRVMAGSRFLFQMHYTPNGAQPESGPLDRSSIGLVFTEASKVKKCVQGAR
jgi:hypothetical protein